MNAINVDTIDISDYSESQCLRDETGANAYDKTLCQGNKDFINFLNKCLLLEQTFEMEKIIQKVLLPAYVCADDEYKKSEKFNRVIKKATQRLIDEPMKKYSHISDVTATLKFHVKIPPKKRVNFITLSTTSVLGKSIGDKRKKVVGKKSKNNPKRPKLDVIAVDSEDEDDLIAVNDKADQMDVISNDDKAKKMDVDDEKITVDAKTKEKEVDDDLIAVEVKTKKTKVDDELIAVDVKIKKTKVYDECIAVDVKTKKTKVDDELIAVDDKENKVKVDNCKLEKTKPKLVNNELGTKIKFKNSLKMKKSKDKLATTVKPDAVSCSNTSIKINDCTKLKEKKSPNVTLEVENNNNTPIEIHDSQEVKIIDEMQVDNNEITANNDNLDNTEEIQNDKENLETSENLSDSGNKLLVPQMEIVQVVKKELPKELNDTEKIERIKVIEAEIEKSKKKIADLEVAEVIEDSSGSAYIRCDKLQAHIVKLYKELCSLIDAEPVKGRQVRLLHLAEGQPEGPLRRLERFLNKQVDEDGVAPFPDFADVVRCVENSNVKDGLGWSKAKVYKEAQALFVYCGRALQKRRQRREWKHLRSQVPREIFDADPAATDPELSAKLELNRQVALRKEADVFEKFTRMETTSEKVSAQDDENSQETNEAGSSTSKEKSRDAEPKGPVNQENDGICNNEETIDGLCIRIKEEPYEVPIENQFRGDISIVIEISDSDSSDGEDDSFCLTQDF